MTAAEPSQQLNSLHPGNWFGYGRAAQDLVALRRFDEAQHQIQQGLEKLPNQVNLLTIATDIYRASGNREKSLEFSQQLIFHHPDNWLGYGRAAEDLVALRRFDEAQHQIQQGLEKLPNQVNLLTIATDIYRASGNREKSFEFSQQLISHHPENWNGYGRAAQDLVALKRFDEAQHQIQQGLEKLPNQVNLLTIATDIYRASGNSEKSLEFSQQLISHHPENWNGYGRAAQDLVALKRFDDLKKLSHTTKRLTLNRDLTLIEDWERKADAGIKALSDMVNDAIHVKVKDFCQSRKILVPIGDFCLSAQFVQDAGGRTFALPFDWTYANPSIIQKTIETDFDDFLKAEYLQSRHPAQRVCGHSLYGNSNFFKHHDPSRNPDRSAFKRRISRFRELVSTQASSMLFFNCRIISKSDDLVNLLEVLPESSKILSFVFLGNEVHEKPAVSLIGSRILQLTFTCDNQNTYYAKRESRPHPWNYTDGSFIHCPYSSTYSRSLLESVLSNH